MGPAGAPTCMWEVSTPALEALAVAGRRGTQGAGLLCPAASHTAPPSAVEVSGYQLSTSTAHGIRSAAMWHLQHASRWPSPLPRTPAQPPVLGLLLAHALGLELRLLARLLGILSGDVVHAHGGELGGWRGLYSDWDERGRCRRARQGLRREAGRVGSGKGKGSLLQHARLSDQAPEHEATLRGPRMSHMQ